MIEAILIGEIGYAAKQVNQSIKIDEQAMNKNIKAATKNAEAKHKIENARKHLLERLQINAIRKNAILNCHFKLFQKQYSMIEKIEFASGSGIQQLEYINSINHQLSKYIQQPAVVSGAILSDSQQFVTFALKGVGGLILQDSKKNLELARKNMSQANALVAQADVICIAYDGIANHIDIVTDLVQNLGALYIRVIKRLEDIFNKNGTIVEKYTNDDINAINFSLKLTETLYSIIDTPVINQEGAIEKASIEAVNYGRDLLDKIG